MYVRLKTPMYVFESTELQVCHQKLSKIARSGHTGGQSRNRNRKNRLTWMGVTAIFIFVFYFFEFQHLRLWDDLRSVPLRLK